MNTLLDPCTRLQTMTTLKISSLQYTALHENAYKVGVRWQSLHWFSSYVLEFHHLIQVLRCVDRFQTLNSKPAIIRSLMHSTSTRGRKTSDVIDLLLNRPCCTQCKSRIDRLGIQQYLDNIARTRNNPFTSKSKLNCLNLVKKRTTVAKPHLLEMQEECIGVRIAARTLNHKSQNVRSSTTKVKIWQRIRKDTWVLCPINSFPRPLSRLYSNNSWGGCHH